MPDHQLPAFFIVGAQKCGTSWLHRQLSSHPQVYLPEDKDHEYFSLLHPDPGQARQAWQQRFAGAAPGQLIGDAAASHFLTPLDQPWHIRPRDYNPALLSGMIEALGQALKIIVLLRDPVARAVSAYLHHYAMGQLDLSHGILEAPDELGIVSIGMYGQHLSHWLGVLDAGNIYLETRPISTSADDILTSICRFLGITDKHPFSGVTQPVFPGIQRIRNEQGIWVKHQRLRQALPDIQRAVPSMSIDGEDYVRLIHTQELAKLHAIFAEDQQLLQQLIATNPIYTGT